MKTKITYEECSKIYKVDANFLEALEESSLLSVIREEDKRYIMYDELSVLERFADWYYNLEINIAGIEIINNLLSKIDEMEQERRYLQQKLKFERRED